MKRIFPIFLLLSVFALVVFACRKSNHPKVILSGAYVGIFQRIGMAYQGPDSVKINFSGDGFDGAALKGGQPEICHGTYEITGDSVEFKNACVFTANFDWTLILSGKYRIYQQGDSLSIDRKYGNTVIYSDTYSLKKQ